MAKRSNENVGEIGKSKIRFIYAEVEGSDQSLQSLMGTMAAAMSRPATAIHHRSLTGGPPEAVPQSSGAPQTNPTEDTSEKTNDWGTPQESGSDANATSGAGTEEKRARGDRQKVDRNASLTIVSDLDLVPQDKQPLRDFLAEKKPTTAEEHVLAFVQYMSETLGLATITTNHVFSCFKPMGRKIPADLPQTIRNIVKKKGWLKMDGESIRVSTTGSNYVLHEMGRTPQGEDK